MNFSTAEALTMAASITAGQIWWSTDGPFGPERHQVLQADRPAAKDNTYFILLRLFDRQPVRWHVTAFKTATMSEQQAYLDCIAGHRDKIDFLQTQLAEIQAGVGVDPTLTRQQDNPVAPSPSPIFTMLAPNLVKQFEDTLAQIFGKKAVVHGKDEDGRAKAVVITVPKVTSANEQEFAHLHTAFGTQHEIERSGTGVKLTVTVK